MPVKASRRSAGPYLPPEATPAVSVRSVALASFIGTTIEWYDFFIYSTAAALVFNKLFFPTLTHDRNLAAFEPSQSASSLAPSAPSCSATSATASAESQ